jgi:hypothetical protein
MTTYAAICGAIKNQPGVDLSSAFKRSFAGLLGEICASSYLEDGKAVMYLRQTRIYILYAYTNSVFLKIMSHVSVNRPDRQLRRLFAIFRLLPYRDCWIEQNTRTQKTEQRKAMKNLIKYPLVVAAELVTLTPAQIVRKAERGDADTSASTLRTAGAVILVVIVFTAIAAAVARTARAAGARISIPTF